MTNDGSAWGMGTRARLQATGPVGRGMVLYLADHPTLPTVARGSEVDANQQVANRVVFDNGYALADLVGAVKRVEDCVVHDVYSRGFAKT